MKRFLKMVSLCVLTIVMLAGCAMKSEYGIVVGKDKNVKLEFIVAYDNEMIDGLMDMGDSMNEDSSETTEAKTHTDEERWKYLEESTSGDSSDFKDFEKKKYDKDGFKGYTFTISMGKIDDLVAESSDKIEIDKIAKDSKLFTKDGNTYKLNLKVSSEDASQMKQYAESIKFDAKLKVTLPNKAKSNNATSVDGNTYTWDLTEAKDIDISFTLDGSSTTTYIIIAVIAAVVVIGVIVFICLNKKKPAAPVQTVQPVEQKVGE